jgi:hypothetical protein
MSKVRGQPRPARRGAAIVLLALVAPPGTLLLRTEPRLDVVLRSATVHLVVVSAISACALAVAVAAAVAAGRSRDGSLVLLALVVACLLGAGALLSLQVGALWRLSWWDYHAFLLTGFDAAVYAVLTGYRRSRALHEVLDGVFAADPMAHISRGYSETLRALIGAVEARDAYTHGHSARVAELSVHLGQRLGLRPAALRTLAEGAYLHDVGKVGIPDHVLNKPGALSDEERAGSSSTRWSAPTSSDGPVAARRPGGHPPAPRALRRPRLPRRPGRGRRFSLAARIVAVADVWDALTPDRAYRAAWPPTAPCATWRPAAAPTRPGLPGRLPDPDDGTGPPPRPRDR